MGYLSQMEAMRKLIQDELLPRVVIRKQDESTTWDHWKCEMCGAESEYDEATRHNPRMAKHGTFCKLGLVLGVVE